jgi:hypothetical protein
VFRLLYGQGTVDDQRVVLPDSNPSEKIPIKWMITRPSVAAAPVLDEKSPP